jgi:hypothetical protein
LLPNKADSRGSEIRAFLRLDLRVIQLLRFTKEVLVCREGVRGGLY